MAWEATSIPALRAGRILSYSNSENSANDNDNVNDNDNDNDHELKWKLSSELWQLDKDINFHKNIPHIPQVTGQLFLIALPRSASSQ